MPIISVEAMPETLSVLQEDSLKGYLRGACPEMFSIESRQLVWQDFSIVFPVFSANSELSHDVVVRIRLNPDAERLAQAPMHALELQTNITETLNSADVPHHDFTVGISLDYGVEIFWCDQNGPV